jgi:hypothetical protein
MGPPATAPMTNPEAADRVCSFDESASAGVIDPAIVIPANAMATTSDFGFILFPQVIKQKHSSAIGVCTRFIKPWKWGILENGLCCPAAQLCQQNGCYKLDTAVKGNDS